MAAPIPGTPQYMALPQAQRMADFRNAQAQTGNSAVALEYMTPNEYKFIQAASIPNAAWASEIKSKFPDQASYLDIPEIAGIFQQAVLGKWSPSILESHLQASQWWLSHSPEQRSWFLLNRSDPAGAAQSVAQQAAVISRQAETMGVQISAGQAMILATNTLQNGWDGATLTDNIMGQNTQGFNHGTLGATKDQLKGQAENYLVPMSDAGLDSWVKNITTGRADPSSFKDYLAGQAKSRFKDPALQEALDKGMSVRDFADPYVQTAANVIGLNPNDVKLSDGKWLAPLDYVDPTTGVKRSMTLDEWQTSLRTDDRYGFDHSANGINQAAQLVNSIKSSFGMS